MNRHLMRMTAVGTLTLAAALAHAGSDERMMDACVQKYIADNLADYPGTVTVTKLATGYQPLTFGAKSQIVVTAVHKKSGEHLGAVICGVARDGTVTVSAPDAVAAAKLNKLAKTPVVARNSAE